MYLPISKSIEKREYRSLHKTMGDFNLAIRKTGIPFISQNSGRLSAGY
jgi:hypothetical protein